MRDGWTGQLYHQRRDLGSYIVPTTCNTEQLVIIEVNFSSGELILWKYIPKGTYALALIGDASEESEDMGRIPTVPITCT